MSHTPGPWFVREPDGDEHTEVYAEKTGAVCYPEPDDAHLIAAAPELLAALKFAVSVLQDNHIARGEAAALAAIRKAEGRSE